MVVNTGEFQGILIAKKKHNDTHEIKKINQL